LIVVVVLSNIVVEAGSGEAHEWMTTGHNIYPLNLHNWEAKGTKKTGSAMTPYSMFNSRLSF
jgi:hypothetical protein